MEDLDVDGRVILKWILTCDSTVGSGTALQVGKLRIRFLMVSVDFFFGKYQGKTHKEGARLALFLIFVLYVLFVLCRSVYCLCVYVYCTTATGWLPNCS
jgi:hypothetical protein